MTKMIRLGLPVVQVMATAMAWLISSPLMQGAVFVGTPEMPTEVDLSDPFHYAKYIRYIAIGPTQRETPEWLSFEIFLDLNHSPSEAEMAAEVDKLKVLEQKDLRRRAIARQYFYVPNERFYYDRIDSMAEEVDMRMIIVAKIEHWNQQAAAGQFWYPNSDRKESFGTTCEEWEIGPQNRPTLFRQKSGTAYDAVRAMGGLANITKGECESAMKLAILYASASVLGETRFNEKHPGVSLNFDIGKSPSLGKHFYDVVPVDPSKFNIGDWVYIKNYNYAELTQTKLVNGEENKVVKDWYEAGLLSEVYYMWAGEHTTVVEEYPVTSGTTAWLYSGLGFSGKPYVQDPAGPEIETGDWVNILRDRYNGALRKVIDKKMYWKGELVRDILEGTDAETKITLAKHRRIYR